MPNLKMKFWRVLLLSLLTGLLWGCASQQASLLDDEFDTGNDIDAELEDLLQLSEADNNGELNASDDFLSRLESDAPFQQVGEEEPFTTVTTEDSEEESLQDVLALLLEDDTDEVDPFPSTMDSFDTFTPVEQAEASTGMETYALESDVLRLEDELENKSLEAENLRRLIDEKNKRLEQLENKQSVQPRSASVVNSGQFSQGYAAARSLFESFNYTGALQAFQELLASQPTHFMADNCQYWIGECYFGMKQYDQAIAEFTKVFNFSRKDKFDDAQMMIAISYIRSGQRDMAKQAFDTFFSNYPDSEYTSKARNMYQKL